jgi:hypothetical protein
MMRLLQLIMLAVMGRGLMTPQGRNIGGRTMAAIGMSAVALRVLGFIGRIIRIPLGLGLLSLIVGLFWRRRQQHMAG